MIKNDAVLSLKNISSHREDHIIGDTSQRESGGIVIYWWALTVFANFAHEASVLWRPVVLCSKI